MLSILMPVKNDAANLRRSLPSVAWAPEIWVVDSHSTDDTAAVAAQHGARVVQFDFNGTWPKKKNWALENLPFSHEWIFILDADEVLPPEAQEEFLTLLARNEDGIAGYWINRRFMFMGKWLRHAYYPNWNLRLIRRGRGRYEKLTESVTRSGDNEVHEHLIVDGPTARLKSEMLHYAFPSVEVFIEKHNRYSNWEARVALERAMHGTDGTLQAREVSGRRKLRSLALRLPMRPLLRFLYIYIAQRGFLDGRAGFRFACLHAFYEYLCILKTDELRGMQNETAQPPPGAEATRARQSTP